MDGMSYSIFTENTDQFKTEFISQVQFGNQANAQKNSGILYSTDMKYYGMKAEKVQNINNKKTDHCLFSKLKHFLFVSGTMVRKK